MVKQELWTAKITRQRYKQFSAIIGEYWRKSKLDWLWTNVYSMWNIRKISPEIDYDSIIWKFYDEKLKKDGLDRNQFYILKDIIDSFYPNINLLKSSYHTIKNRYTKNIVLENKFKDEV